MRSQDQRLRGPARALLVIDQRVLSDIVKLALNYLWGADYVAESKIVDRHIRNLRVKLKNHSGRPQYIVTVPGRGYLTLPLGEVVTAVTRRYDDPDSRCVKYPHTSVSRSTY